MKENKLTVKEWCKKFKKGEFNKSDTKTQIEAGWFDWFCFNDELVDRTKKIAKFLNQIKNCSVINDLTVSLKNNCPATGKMYDSILLSEKYTIILDNQIPITIYENSNPTRPKFSGTRIDAVLWFKKKE